MKEHQKKAFDFASETTKQLINISTAIITLTVTFSKDILGNNVNSPKIFLVWTWGVFIGSIICGVLTLMTLTGTLQPLKKDTTSESQEDSQDNAITPAQEDECTNMNINNINIRLFSGLQAVLFVGAIIMTGIFGYKSLSAHAIPNKAKEGYLIIRHSTLNSDTTKYLDTLYLPKEVK